MATPRDQYENWVYPAPVYDLEEDFRAGRFDRSDPSLFRRKFWPRPVEPDNLKILVAGCGTTQAARLAFRNPNCDVVGVDFSQSSLNHAAFLKEKHHLKNLRLHCLSLLDIETLGEQFNLIVSSGVLHHLPDPDAGLRKLKAVLLPHGVINIMVYGWYSRFGVYAMQEAFRLLGVQQTTAGVALVRETLNALPSWHHVKSYLRIAPDLDYDAGVVDTFSASLRNRAYSGKTGVGPGQKQRSALSRLARSAQLFHIGPHSGFTFIFPACRTPLCGGSMATGGVVGSGPGNARLFALPPGAKSAKIM